MHHRYTFGGNPSNTFKDIVLTMFWAQVGVNRIETCLRPHRTLGTGIKTLRIRNSHSLFNLRSCSSESRQQCRFLADR